MDDSTYYRGTHWCLQWNWAEAWVGWRLVISPTWRRGLVFQRRDFWLQLLPCLTLHVWWFPKKRKRRNTNAAHHNPLLRVYWGHR